MGDLHERIIYWSELIKQHISCTVNPESSIDNDQSFVFKSLLDEFINPDNRILFVNCNVSVEDYNAIVEFMGPSGPVFSFVNFLSKNDTIFALPFDDFLPEFKIRLIAGQISNFTREKCNFKARHILCNAFEYFFYRFYNHVFQAHQIDQKHFNFIKQEALNYAYGRIFQDYLNSFLPCHSELSIKIQKAKERNPTTPEFLNDSSTCDKNLSGKIREEAFIQATATKSEVNFKLLHDADACDTLKVYDYITETCQIFYVLFDLWFNKWRKVSINDCYLCVLIRYMVHRFYTSYYTHLTADSGINDPSILAFNKYLYREMFIPKVGLFLITCFHQWPKDMSFLNVCDLWIIFIRPWLLSSGTTNRYFYQQNFDDFVRSNQSYYWKMFKPVAEQFFHMDISFFEVAQRLYSMSIVLPMSNTLSLLNFDCKRLSTDQYEFYDSDLKGYVISLVDAMECAEQKLKNSQTWSQRLIQFCTFEDDTHWNFEDEIQLAIRYLRLARINFCSKLKLYQDPYTYDHKEAQSSLENINHLNAERSNKGRMCYQQYLCSVTEMTHDFQLKKRL